MNTCNLKSLLDQQRDMLKRVSSPKDKLSLFNTIIQIEDNINDNLSKECIYKDIKSYIKSYIESINDESFDYDSIDVKKMLQHIHLLPHIKQISVLLYAERMLLGKEYQYEATYCRELIRKTQFIYALNYEKPKKFSKIII